MDRTMRGKTYHHTFVLWITIEDEDGQEVVEPVRIMRGGVVTDTTVEDCEVDTDRGSYIERSAYVDQVQVNRDVSMVFDDEKPERVSGEAELGAYLMERVAMEIDEVVQTHLDGCDLDEELSE